MQDACKMARVILSELYCIVPQRMAGMFVPRHLYMLTKLSLSGVNVLHVDAELMSGVFVEGLRKVYVLASYLLSPESASFNAPNFSPKIRSIMSSPPILFRKSIAACRLLCQLSASTIELNLVTSNSYSPPHR